MKQLLLALSCITLVLVSGSAVRAAESPSFPSCSEPSSGLEVNSDGNHAIAGDADLKNGNDKVYGLDNGNTLQCFCPDNGDGVQTNWLNASGLNQRQIDTLEEQGWIFIPDGSGWGLAAAPYLAQNLNYNCGGNSDTNNNGGNGGNPGAPVCTDTAPGGAPTLVSAVTNADNSVTLTWTPAPDPVTYYLVAYGTQPGVFTYGNPNVGGHDTTSYTVKGLSGGVTYYFEVRAGNGCMPGPFSNSLSSQPTGGAVAGAAEGFTPVPTPTPDVLGTSSSVDTAGVQVCGCIWWPIIVGEVIILTVLLLALRNDKNWKKKMLAGFLIATLAYVVFLIWNRKCLGGYMDLHWFTIPCKYFWALAGGLWLAISGIFWLLRRRV